MLVWHNQTCIVIELPDKRSFRTIAFRSQQVKEAHLARIPVGWHPEEIKSQLRMRFGPITHLSETWGFSRNAITLTLRRHDYSPKVEARIAEVLGVSAHEIWPARWAKDGTSQPRSNTFDPIAVPPVRNSQNAKAA